jgi:hypothetical protein
MRKNYYAIINPSPRTDCQHHSTRTRRARNRPKNSKQPYYPLSGGCLFFFLVAMGKFAWCRLSGLDIQKNFPAYRLVWLLPVLAGATILINLAGQKTDLIRRLAGLCPFVILVYALNELGSQLFQSIAIGGWLALLGGAALIVIPTTRKSKNPL